MKGLFNRPKFIVKDNVLVDVILPIFMSGKTLVIPSEINGIKIQTVGRGALSRCSNRCERIVFGDEITSFDCNFLALLGSSLMAMMDKNIPTISSIVWPSKCKRIPGHFFENYLPNFRLEGTANVEHIGEAAFKNSGIRDFPDGLVAESDGNPFDMCDFGKVEFYDF